MSPPKTKAKMHTSHLVLAMWSTSSKSSSRFTSLARTSSAFSGFLRVSSAAYKPESVEIGQTAQERYQLFALFPAPHLADALFFLISCTDKHRSTNKKIYEFLGQRTWLPLKNNGAQPQLLHEQSWPLRRRSGLKYERRE